MGIRDHHRSCFFCFGLLLFFLLATAAGGTICRAAQNPQSKPGQGKPQKVQNPLNDLLDEAQAALDKDDFAAAIPPLQKFLAEKPDVAYAHFQLAYAYTGLHQADEARAEYEKAIALDPKMSAAQLNLGILLLEKDPAAAAISLRKAVELLPSQSRPRFLLGLALQRTGDFAGASEAFAAAVSLDPNDAESLVHLGDVNLQLKKPAEAEKNFRLVLSRDPKSAPALRGLALSLDAQGKPEAVDAYRNYLAAAPQDAEVRTRFVHLLVANKQFDEALSVSEKSQTGQAPSLDDLRLRADIQIGQNKLDDAIKTLQLAITLSPRDPQLHGGLGRLYLQKRAFPEAERELKIAIQLDQRNVIYWKDLASTFYLAGNYASALAGYDVVDKFEQPGAGEWFIRALCYDKLDQVQAALDAYRKFLDLDHNQHSDQIWQANQRIHVLEKRAEKKK
jgi:Flp pilus assembly protein TadD